MVKVDKISIKDLDIPYIIQSYKTSKHIKIYFKDSILKITKPTRVSKENAMKFVYENADVVYENYLKSLASLRQKTKNWKSGEKILYKGIQYTILRNENNYKKIDLFIDDNERKFIITVPKNEEECEIKKKVDKLVKKHLKIKAEEIISEALPKWSNVMKISYNTFKIKDTISRYGSCIPNTRALQFSARLAMLPQEEVDAIVVHELSHIIYKNHDRNFYNLVGKYIPNYKEIDRWLKNNSNQIYI